jgi:hypothetical protein
MSKDTLKKYWRIWAKAMGPKASDDNYEADTAAVIRTIFWVLNAVTCVFIIASNGKNLGMWLN